MLKHQFCQYKYLEGLGMYLLLFQHVSRTSSLTWDGVAYNQNVSLAPSLTSQLPRHWIHNDANHLRGKAENIVIVFLDVLGHRINPVGNIASSFQT